MFGVQSPHRSKITPRAGVTDRGSARGACPGWRREEGKVGEEESEKLQLRIIFCPNQSRSSKFPKTPLGGVQIYCTHLFGFQHLPRRFIGSWWQPAIYYHDGGCCLRFLIFSLPSRMNLISRLFVNYPRAHMSNREVVGYNSSSLTLLVTFHHQQCFLFFTQDT